MELSQKQRITVKYALIGVVEEISKQIGMMANSACIILEDTNLDLNKDSGLKDGVAAVKCGTIWVVLQESIEAILKLLK